MALDLGLIFAMGFVALILILMIFILDKEHNYLKLLFFFSIIFIIFQIGAYATNIEEGMAFYKQTIGIVIIFTGYVFLYFVYSVFDYFGKIPSSVSRRNPKK